MSFPNPLFLIRCAVTLSILCILQVVTYAQDQTETGFYYPTGVSTPKYYARFGDRGGNNDDKLEGYFEGKWHCGIDIQADEGDPVFAIAKGDIVVTSPGGWTMGGKWQNFGYIIRHKLADGKYFYAVYGHLRRPEDPDHPGKWMTDEQIRKLPKASIDAGDKLGTIGHWDLGDHLHFGIYQDPGDSKLYPTMGFGIQPMPRPNPSNRNSVLSYGNWLDPITFIQTYRPFSVETTNTAKQGTTPPNDISGRWKGESTSKPDNKHYKDKVSLLEADGRVYSVARREELNSHIYIVSANDSDRATYFGDHTTSQEEKNKLDQHVIEKKGSWVWADRGSKQLSPDGNTITSHAEYDNFLGTVIEDGTLKRVAGLKQVPTLSNLLLKFHGMVKKGEEITAGEMNWSESKRYLLVYLNYPGSKLELIATRPDGTRLTANSPGVTYIADEIPARLYVQNPLHGRWTFSVKGIEVDGDAEPFWVLAAPSDIGPDGKEPPIGGGVVINSGTDWQAKALLACLASIVILGALCIAVVIIRRRSMTSITTPAVLAWVQVHSPGVPAYNEPITDRIWLIGRDPSCQTVLSDPEVSTLHAKVQHDDAGATLTDAGSTNGTYLNADLVDRQVKLQREGRIRVGNTILIYFPVEDYNDSFEQ